MPLDRAEKKRPFIIFSRDKSSRGLEFLNSYFFSIFGPHQLETVQVRQLVPTWSPARCGYLSRGQRTDFAIAVGDNVSCSTLLGSHRRQVLPSTIERTDGWTAMSVIPLRALDLFMDSRKLSLFIFNPIQLVTAGTLFPVRRTVLPWPERFMAIFTTELLPNATVAHANMTWQFCWSDEKSARCALL